MGFWVGLTTNKTMNNGILKLTVEDLKSAAISGVLMALYAMFAYVSQTGDIFAIDPKDLLNIGVTALFTSIVSLTKNAFTTESGKFGGVIKVK